jgi:hypothetical protein
VLSLPDDSVIDPRRAARLTLLAIRSGVPHRLRFRPDVVRLGRRGEVVGVDAAVDVLAARPKPIKCFADVEDDEVLVLDFPSFLPGLRETPSSTRDAWYAERYGTDYRQQAVLCLGRFEWTIATFGELEAWEVDYPLLGKVGYGGNDFTGGEKAPRDALAAARRAGVVHVRDYRHPEGDAESTKGRITIGRVDPPADAGRCASCRVRPARFVVEWFTGERRPRALCQRCIDEELPTEEFDFGRMMERERSERAVAEATKTAEELARMAEWDAVWWALMPKPPFIRAFIDRHRRP